MDTHLIVEKKLALGTYDSIIGSTSAFVTTCIWIASLWYTFFTFFSSDTTVTFKSAPVTWSPPIMPPFTTFACFYSGLLLKSPLAKTLVAGAEIRTSNLFPTQCTWSSMYWTRKVYTSVLTDTKLRHLSDRGQCFCFSRVFVLTLEYYHTHYLLVHSSSGRVMCFQS